MFKNKTNITQEETWNKISILWAKYRKKTFKEVKDFLKNKKGKILDLGCGHGRNFIKKPNLEYYSVDFSEKMLELAEKHAKRKSIKAKLFKTNLNKLPFKKNFFDSAIFIATLHCIETKKSRKKSIQELYRVLKPKAKAIITVWSKNHNKVQKFMNKSKNITIPWKHNGKEYARYYYIYDKKELEDLLKKVGFKIISSKENKNIILIIQKPK